MMMMRATTVTMTLGLTWALSACGQGPTDEDYDDIATSVGAVLADDTGSEIESIQDAVEAAAGEMPNGMSRSGSGQLEGQRGRLDYQFALTCKNASGADQAACDATTDWAQLTMSWSGEINTVRRSATASRTGDWTLSGLTGTQATLVGQGTFDLDSEFEALFRPVMRNFQLSYRAEYDNVLIDTARRTIVGGQITYEIEADRNETRRRRSIEASFDVTAEVTFAADGTAQIVLDGDRAYLVDLPSGTVAQM